MAAERSKRPWAHRVVLGVALLSLAICTACDGTGSPTTTTPALLGRALTAPTEPRAAATDTTEAPAPKSSAPETDLPPMSLEIARDTGQSLTLRGLVADQATADALLTMAQELYPAPRVIGELTVGEVAPTGGTITLTGNVRPKDAVVGTATALELAALIGATVDDRQTIAANGPGPALTGLLNALVALEPITFETDSAVITPESEVTLTKALGFFESYPEVLILVQGHTDSDGSDAYNFDLSELRAESVVTFLIDQGVAPHRLRSRGFGETTPVADNATEEGRAANRRIEFSVRK